MKKVVRNFVLAVMLLVLCAPQIASAASCDHDYESLGYSTSTESRGYHQHACRMDCPQWSHSCIITRHWVYEGFSCTKCGDYKTEESYYDAHNYTCNN